MEERGAVDSGFIQGFRGLLGCLVMRMLALKERVSSPKGDPGFPVRLVCPIETSNKTPTCLKI
jgi:hypothetical protein